MLVVPFTGKQVNGTIVIIIDALDEAIDLEANHDFLEALSTGLPQLPKFVRVLVTSRYHPVIEETIGKISNLLRMELPSVET
jgi:hypothetical protein